MGYAAALFKRETEKAVHRAYVAESLRGLGRGEYLTARYLDLIHPPEDFDVNEVIDGVIERAGLEVKDEPSQADGGSRGR